MLKVILLHSQEAGGELGEAVALGREAEHQQAAVTILSTRLLLQKLSFFMLELRLYLNKLLGLRLGLSELGCTQNAWSEIYTFKEHAVACLSRLQSEA